MDGHGHRITLSARLETFPAFTQADTLRATRFGDIGSCLCGSLGPKSCRWARSAHVFCDPWFGLNLLHRLLFVFSVCIFFNFSGLWLADVDLAHLSAMGHGFHCRPGHPSHVKVFWHLTTLFFNNSCADIFIRWIAFVFFCFLPGTKVSCMMLIYSRFCLNFEGICYGPPSPNLCTLFAIWRWNE